MVQAVRRAMMLLLPSVMVACGDGSSRLPSTPTGVAGPIGPDGATVTASDVLRLSIGGCPESLVVGQRVVCVATAHVRSGGTANVTAYADWLSSNPSAVSVFGPLLFPRSEGSAVVSATYLGHAASVAVTAAFPEADALSVGSTTSQGPFGPGSTATFYLTLVYTVVTGATGQLRLQVSDQNGVIATSATDTVARGADLRTLGVSVVVPQDSTRLCPAAILQVGSVTIREPSDGQRFCVAVPPGTN